MTFSRSWPTNAPKKPSFRRRLRRVQEDASAARAFFRTWKELEKARGDAGLLATMNDHRHAAFFITTMDGCFRLAFLSLRKMFDRNRRSCESWAPVRGDWARTTTSISSRRSRTCLPITATRSAKIKLVTNKTVAHNDLASSSEILEEANVTPDQIEGLIDASCRILNRIGERIGYSRQDLGRGAARAGRAAVF